MQRNKRLLNVAGVVLVATAVFLYQHYSGDLGQTGYEAPASVANSLTEADDGAWVQLDGRIERTLDDDLDGSRHQRFIMRLPHEQTVLVAHNIDLAPRIPLQQGDTVLAYGEYQWNQKGGVLHWTHHDPQGRKYGGWIEHEGMRYR